MLILAALLLAACASPAAASVTSIAKELTCPCGCGDVLSTCDCDTARELTASIKQKLAAGQSPEQIIQTLVSRYGEAVLGPKSHT